MQRHIPFATALLVAALAAPALSATIRYPGVHNSLQDALDALQTGDTLLIGRGTLMETGVLAGMTDVTIRGQRGAILDGQTSEFTLSLDNCTDVTVKGLTITGSSEDAVLLNLCTRVTLSRMLIRDVGGDGIDVEECTDVTIDRTTVDRVGVDFDGIDFDGGSGHVLSRLKIRNVPDGSGIDMEGVSGVRIERCTIEDITLGDGIDFAAGDDEDPVTGCTVKGCRIFNVGDDAIDMNGSNNTITRNLIRDAAEDGIEIDDASANNSGNLLERNRVFDVTEDGFVIRGTLNEIRLNRVTNCGEDAYDIEFDDDDGRPLPTMNTLDRNSAVSPGFDGLDVEGDNNEILGCRFTKPGTAGIRLSGDGNLIKLCRITKPGTNGVQVGGSVTNTVIEKTSVTRAGQAGFLVNGTPTTLRNCRATKSGTFDLDDNTGSATLEGNNRFKTVDDTPEG